MAKGYKDHNHYYDEFHVHQLFRICKSLKTSKIVIIVDKFDSDSQFIINDEKAVNKLNITN